MRNRREVRWAALVRDYALIGAFLAFVAACASSSQTGSETHWIRCAVTSDCASGRVCQSGICLQGVSEASDAAARSSSTPNDTTGAATLGGGAGPTGTGGSGGSSSAKASATSPAAPGTGGAAASSPSGATCTSNDLVLAFAPDMYSAYIPGSSHAFQVPATVVGVSGTVVTWTASDPSMVLIEPVQPVASSGLMTNEQVTLQTLKAGDVIITANAAGRCGSSTLHISAATEAQWQAGNERYNNMNPLPVVPTDGGIPISVTNWDPSSSGTGYVLDPPGMPPACTNCHGDMATSNVFRTITETPEQTGGYSDQVLAQIFVQGVVPMNGYFDQSIIPSFVWSAFHKWSDITGDQVQAMVVYLRWIVPKSAGGGRDFNGAASR